jgi:hypothetical protein
MVWWNLHTIWSELMSKPQVQIHNAETGEIIIRDMNAEELAVHAKEAAELAEMKADIANKAAAKTALLERLGITAEEAALLFK